MDKKLKILILGGSGLIGKRMLVRFKTEKDIFNYESKRCVSEKQIKTIACKTKISQPML